MLYFPSLFTFLLSQTSVSHLFLSPQPPISSSTSSFSVDDLLTSLRQQSNSERVPIHPLPSHLLATGLHTQVLCFLSAVTHETSTPQPKASSSVLFPPTTVLPTVRLSVININQSNSILICCYFSFLKKYFSWLYFFLPSHFSLL